MSDSKKQNPLSRSKIVKYKLEEDVITLRRAGLSYQQIADEINASGKLPEGETVEKYAIARFLELVPEAEKQIVKENKQRLIQVVNSNLDIIHEITYLFNKTKTLLEDLEKDADAKGKIVNPYQYKAVVSELREFLKQMTDIQKEINDYNNIRKFMEIVLSTLKEECPEKIPVIAEKLKLAKGTQWFADILKRGSIDD